MEYSVGGSNLATIAISLAVLSGLSGCGALYDRLDPTAVSPRGLSPSLESLNYEKVAGARAKLMTQLVTMAGLSQPPAASDPNWQLVMKAGIGFVGEQCNEYMTALFKFDKDHRAIRSGLTATGATAATIMGLTATPAAPIAATAAAFGLATSYFDANVNSVIFQISPAAVRNIVTQAQDTYRTTAMNNLANYQSRPDVILALQGYLQLCTPVAIESAVEQAASSTQFESKSGDTTKDPSPALQQTSSQGVSPSTDQTVLSSTVTPTPTVQRIEAWLKQGGIINAQNMNAAALNAWIANQHVDAQLQGKPFPVLLNTGGGGRTIERRTNGDRPRPSDKRLAYTVRKVR